MNLSSLLTEEMFLSILTASIPLTVILYFVIGEIHYRIVLHRRRHRGGRR